MKKVRYSFQVIIFMVVGVLLGLSLQAGSLDEREDVCTLPPEVVLKTSRVLVTRVPLVGSISSPGSQVHTHVLDERGEPVMNARVHYGRSRTQVLVPETSESLLSAQGDLFLPRSMLVDSEELNIEAPDYLSYSVSLQIVSGYTYYIEVRLLEDVEAFFFSENFFLEAEAFSNKAEAQEASIRL